MKEMKIKIKKTKMMASGSNCGEIQTTVVSCLLMWQLLQSHNLFINACILLVKLLVQCTFSNLVVKTSRGLLNMLVSIILLILSIAK